MDDPHKQLPQAADLKNILPDVVHSQQIPAIGDVATDEIEAETATRLGENVTQDVEDSQTESISEHIPSKIEYSTESDNDINVKLPVEAQQDKASASSPVNIPFPHSPVSDTLGTHEFSKQSTSWPLDVNIVSDVHLSEESPVNLALSSDNSKDITNENKSPPTSIKSNPRESPVESPRRPDYLDSLESSQKCDISQGSAEGSAKSDNVDESLNKDSSGSEEIIKLDIRGQGAPKLPSAKIIFGPPPEGSTIFEPSMKPIPVFPNLLSPFLVGANDNVKVEELFNLPSEDAFVKNDEFYPIVETDKADFSRELSLKEDLVDKLEESADNSPKECLSDKIEQSEIDENSPKESLSDKSDQSESGANCPKQSLSIKIAQSESGENSPKESLSDKIEQNDLLVEELSVGEETKEKENQEESLPPKSMPPDETMSFSTMTTDYKTICEEYHTKLVHLEGAIAQRDDLIAELTVSLQRSVRERDDLRHENRHLAAELCAHGVSTPPDGMRAQLSDFFKYQSLIKDESTRFFSAVTSGGSSLRGSNGERDNDREEITVDHSREDLKSSDDSDDFQTGFENKIGTVIDGFDEYIEENLRNKLRESLIRVLGDELAKMKMEFDTEVKDLESQVARDKQASAVETRRLRELLASVKAGDADIEELRKELSLKHEKEMENLRTYFEKKCSDMERSYSEEVWRGRCASAGSASSLEGGDGGGDRARRRTRSADLPSLSIESTPLEQAVKQIAKKYEQQIEDSKTEHVAYVRELQERQRDAVAALEDQISQLKAHIQNSESNVLYPQDIDLELEKKMEAQLEQRLEEAREQVRQDVVNHLQEQLQVCTGFMGDTALTDCHGE